MLFAALSDTDKNKFGIEQNQLCLSRGSTQSNRTRKKSLDVTYANLFLDVSLRLGAVDCNRCSGPCPLDLLRVLDHLVAVPRPGNIETYLLNQSGHFIQDLVTFYQHMVTFEHLPPLPLLVRFVGIFVVAGAEVDDGAVPDAVIDCDYLVGCAGKLVYFFNVQLLQYHVGTGSIGYTDTGYTV